MKLIFATGMLLGCAIAIAGFASARAGMRTFTKASDGETVLTFSPMVRIFGWILMIAGPVGLTIFVIVDPPDDGMQWLPFLILISIPIAIGLFLVLKISIVHVFLSQQGVRATSFGKKDCSIAWTDVSEVKWGMSRGVSGFHIQATNGRRISISAYMRGLGHFRDSITQNLQPEVYRKTKAGFVYLDALKKFGRAK